MDESKYSFLIYSKGDFFYDFFFEKKMMIELILDINTSNGLFGDYSQ